MSDELRAWIESYVDPTDRLRAAPLFLNPRTGERWTHYALRDAWLRACEAAGVGHVRLYEGTKHTMATEAIRLGVDERALQTFLGYKDVRSTRRYAQLPEHAMISVLRGRVGGLSVARLRAEKPKRIKHSLVVPTGVEPVSPG